MSSKHFSAMAGEFYILSCLYRQSINAHLTLGNTKAIDIVLALPDSKIKTIDVKTIKGSDSIPITNITISQNHFIVVVIYKNKFEDLDEIPDIYIVPSKVAAAKQITYSNGKRKNIFKRAIIDYKDRWDLLK